VDCLSPDHSVTEGTFSEAITGLVPVMELAEPSGLSKLLAESVRFDPEATAVASAGVNRRGN